MLRRRVLETIIVVGLTGCFDDPDEVESASASAGESSTGGSTSGEPTTGTSGTSTTMGTSAGPGTSASTTDDPSPATTGGNQTGTTGEDPPGTELPEPDFVDDFQRADANDIGNGWIEELPTAFELIDGSVRGTGIAGDFWDWFVYRDDMERDIVVVTEFTINVADSYNEPFVVARAQPSSVTGMEPTYFEAYTAVANSEDPPGSLPAGGSLCIMRFESTGIPPTQVWCQPMSEGLEVGPLYRLALVVENVDPVDLLAVLQIYEPNGGQWVDLAVVEGTDGTDAAITQAGYWGFAGGEGSNELPNYRYEFFSAALLD